MSPLGISRPRIAPETTREILETTLEAFGVTLEQDTLDRLDRAELNRLEQLLARLRTRPEGPGVVAVPSPDERARAEAYASAVEALTPPSPERKREQQLHVAYVREFGRPPSRPALAVLRDALPGQTLDDLRPDLAAVEPPRTPTRPFWSQLSDGQIAELETLVAKALGEPGYFEARREGQVMDVKLGQLIKRTEEAPERATVIPRAALEQVFTGKLAGVDLAPLTLLAATFATRAIHPRQTGLVVWAEDGETLVVLGRSPGSQLLPSWTRDDLTPYNPHQSLVRLSKAGWLTLEPSATETRIGRGPRLLALDAARP